MANFYIPYKNWIAQGNNGIISFGVGMGVVVLMSLITMFAHLWVREIYVCFPFLVVFGICLGLIVGGLGSSIYMLTEYGAFILFIIELYIYTYYVEVEFVFWKNYILGTVTSIVYLVIIDGAVIANWLAVGCLIAGALFFDFYAILFSQFIIARNAEMFRIGDYVYGALKFNMDMGDVIMKLFLDYLMPIYKKLRERAKVNSEEHVDKASVCKAQITKEKEPIVGNLVNGSTNTNKAGLTPTVIATPQKECKDMEIIAKRETINITARDRDNIQNIDIRKLDNKVSIDIKTVRRENSAPHSEKRCENTLAIEVTSKKEGIDVGIQLKGS